MIVLLVSLLVCPVGVELRFCVRSVLDALLLMVGIFQLVVEFFWCQDEFLMCFTNLGRELNQIVSTTIATSLLPCFLFVERLIC